MSSGRPGRRTVQEMNALYGEQTVFKASWMGCPETRQCNSEWQVCYHVNIIVPCVRIVTS